VAPPPQGELDERERDAAAGPELHCPRCGVPYEPDQEYCLECGLRLPEPPAGVIATLGGAWRRRLGWYPGDWVWGALLALVVAALAATGAMIFVSHDTKGSEQTLERTTGTEHVTTTTPTAPTRPATTATAPTGPSATATGTTAPRPPAPPPAAGPQLTAWPAGKSGWTVILVSALDRGAATDAARRALRSGLTDVGVLDSSRYSTLHPGYFVVFSGTYDSESETHSALATARSKGYLSAYSRRITP
jgi:cell division septation protein DedD